MEATTKPKSIAQRRAEKAARGPETRAAWDLKPLSPEARSLGVAFIKALLKEGHDYSSIKGALLTCMVDQALVLAGGVVKDAAEKIGGIDRNELHILVNRLGMRKRLEEIRRAAEAAI